MSASSALSQALENLDAELRNDPKPKDSQDGHNDRLGALEADLDSYKKALEDAQMQHFELSKQSRIILAEKDVEIQVLKSKLGEVGAIADVTGGADSLTVQRITAEKQVLEASLQELELQLRNSLAASNEATLLRTQHDDLVRRYDTMKADFAALRSDAETKEKQRGETIESLVSEYSRLAAELEVSSAAARERERLLVQENELLVMRVQALEHSISELADRAAKGGEASKAAESAAAASAASPGEIEQLAKELKEAKNKI
eukprot:gene6380-7929_t